MKDLCFLGVANSWYKELVPLYLYSIFRAYPESAARIFLDSEPEPDTRKALDVVKHEGFDFEILDDEFCGYRTTNRAPAMWRFLLFTGERHPLYSQFKYIYITDIDFIICPESPSLLGQHLAHCAWTKLPYSAHVRGYEPKLVAGRLFAKREFAYIVSAITEQYDQLVYKCGEEIFDIVPRHPDEHLLYKIITESGLSAPKQVPSTSSLLEFILMDPWNFSNDYFSPHHGLHLGIFRKELNLVRRIYGPLFQENFYQAYLNWALGLQYESSFQYIVNQMSETPRTLVKKLLELARSVLGGVNG